MKNEPGLLNGLFSSFSDYYSAQTKYLRSNALLKSADMGARASAAGSVLIIGSFMLLFLSLGAAFWLGEIFLSYKIGFLCVGAFYLLCFAAFLAGRKKIFGTAYKNRILRNISGDQTDYDALAANNEQLRLEASQTETSFKQHLAELKETVNQLQTQLNALREGSPEIETPGAGPITKTVVSNVVSLLLNAFVLKNAGIVKRTIVPMIANSLISGSFPKEGKNGSLLSRLKTKLFKRA